MRSEELTIVESFKRLGPVVLVHRVLSQGNSTLDRLAVGLSYKQLIYGQCRIAR
jgi:hypothetical protein